MKRLWNSKAIQDSLPGPKTSWIFDGEHLAWSKHIPPNRSSRTVSVDLDVEEGGTTKGRVHHVLIQPTKQLEFAELGNYLKRKGPWSIKVLEIMSTRPLCIHDHDRSAG